MDNDTRFKVYIEEKTQDYGKLYIEPLERGYGDTLGNALRRLLLSSIRGAAVTAVKIEGVLHEFSTIKGVREDVIEILMNLKHIPIRAKTGQNDLNADGFKIITLDSDELPKDFFTRSENPGVITAKDMPWDNDFEFFGDGILCSLEPNAHLLMEIYVERGVGYLSAERERPANPPLPVNALLADAIFSPVKRVNYTIEPARVGQSIDYERLVLEVWTNGAISPDQAVGEASRIAEDYFAHIADTVGTAPLMPSQEDTQTPSITVKAEKTPVTPPQPPQPPKPEGPHSIHELELSIRSENCLLRGGITTLEDLLQKSRDDLLKIRNLGKISLTEIEKKLASMGHDLKKETKKNSEEGNDLDDNAEANSEVNSESTAESSEENAESKSEPESEAETQVTEPKTKKTTRKSKKAKPEPEQEAEKESEPEAELEPEEKPKKRTRKKAKE
ncbi:MAG: DNA-directed RNA polymerase subunit alpha [Synergistaceae bacterium]|nr:DNA-directed RNA polymerase subunit alpha [Synergistaceae bacterium]MBR0250076.1 DNA-directed RNA polymerase subunit alpha [Synergistaceae bacterium]